MPKPTSRPDKESANCGRQRLRADQADAVRATVTVAVVSFSHRRSCSQTGGGYYGRGYGMNGYYNSAPRSFNPKA